MPRKPQKIVRKSESQDWKIEYLLFGYYTLPSGKRSVLKTLMFGETPLPAWGEVRDTLLPQFIREHPCQRPFAWWDDDAPEPRRRVGGAGEISEDRYSIKFGVPASNTWWAGISPNDPPAYESQAVYLQRLGLLTEAEKRWLAQHPEALEPVKVGYLAYDMDGKMVVVEAPEAI